MYNLIKINKVTAWQTESLLYLRPSPDWNFPEIWLLQQAQFHSQLFLLRSEAFLLNQVCTIVVYGIERFHATKESNDNIRVSLSVARNNFFEDEGEKHTTHDFDMLLAGDWEN